MAANTLFTVGNPAIQLVSNSLYCNDAIQSPSTQVASATEADVIYLSSGSFNETLNITDKTVISVNAPTTGATICEVLGGLNINGTSENVRISSLSIKGSSSTISGVGRHTLWRCVFSGASSGSRHTITIGASCTKFLTFENCEFNSFCDIVVPAIGGGVVIYFINCNFAGATLTLNNPSALQVIINNCAGLLSYPSSARATLIGLNALTTGASQVDTYNLKTTLINGSAYPPASSGVSVSNQAQYRIPFCTSTNNVLDTFQYLSYDTISQILTVAGSVNSTNFNGSLVNVDSVQTNSATVVNDLSVNTINSQPYPPPANLTDVPKQFYYLSTTTAAQSDFTIENVTPVQLLFDITKYYKVTIVYNFDIVSGSNTQVQFSIRDDNGADLQSMFINTLKQHQTVTLVFYFQPLIALSYLHFLASSGNQINNAYNDLLIWDIQEIQ